MPKVNFRALSLILLLTAALTTTPGVAGDWPMWRYDAGRTAASPHDLPDRLHLQWVCEYPQVEPVWDDPLNRDIMQYDRVYEPVVLGQTLFVGSNASDRLVALDTATGREKWAFYTSGPVRFPAVAAGDRVYFVSDDGHLYCVDAEEGTLIWAFRGGPSDQKLLGNKRLISAWPARGGPVLQDGVVYFAAGIWPFMGVFVHALDAETGKVIWTNDGSGSMYMLQPHNSPAYGGVAPQGAMVVSDDKLLVPCGRSVPACFDRHTGEFLYYRLTGKTGGAFVCAIKDWFVSYHRDKVTSLYSLGTGESFISRFGNVPVLTDDVFYSLGDSITAWDVESIEQVTYDRRVRDRTTGKYRTVEAKMWRISHLWKLGVDSSGDLIVAGNRLYAGGEGVVSAVDLRGDGNRPAVVWQEEVEGTASRIVAADDRLFVVTDTGRIYAFGGEEAEPVVQARTGGEAPEEMARLWEARSLLEAAAVSEGYGLVYGVEDGDLVEALARQSDLHLIAIAPDPGKVDGLRRRLDAAGLYGSRVSVVAGDAFSLELSPYLASLTVLEDLDRAGYKKEGGFFERIFHSMRPYGGVTCLRAGKDERGDLAQQIQDAQLPGAQIRTSGEYLLMSREGALPGSADWTHQYGDVANTLKSDDHLVKLPLGLLWFGGSPNTDVLPRHGHGPPEQVMGGRLFIEGMDCLSARDVYTGRVLWKRAIPNLGNYGVYFDDTYADTPLSTAYNQIHIPGANARGTNYVVAEDRVYVVVEGGRCLVLDPATGDSLETIRLPSARKGGKPVWGYIGVYRDHLIAGEGAIRYTDYMDLEKVTKKRMPFYNYDITSSKRLVVMDRYTGDVRWTRKSRLGFRHNAIVAGRDRLYCIDMIPPMIHDAMKRRGWTLPKKPGLLALDVQTGKGAWSTTEGVFGTWLGYSDAHDVLLQAGRPSRDMLRGEPREGMAAYRGSDGEVLWRSDVTYGGPCILHGEWVITDRYAYSLLDGEQRTRRDPVTDEETPWAYSRRYGCNYPVASEHMLTFRSAAAGYYDLENDGGTGNLGGFKSGCTSNLVAANGVLNAPDYTRTCNCAYQNQTSLALVHMPDVEMWVTYFGQEGDGPVRKIGINLGAPGNRRGPDGRFWVAHPLLPHVRNPEKESGVTADVQVDLDGGEFYTHHVSSIAGGESPNWVAASGCEGISRLELGMNTAEPFECRVRLHFAEPGPRSTPERSFDVAVEGEMRLAGFDVAHEAGGEGRSVVRTFEGVEVADGKVTIEFSPRQARPLLCGVEVTVTP